MSSVPPTPPLAGDKPQRAPGLVPAHEGMKIGDPHASPWLRTSPSATCLSMDVVRRFSVAMFSARPWFVDPRLGGIDAVGGGIDGPRRAGKVIVFQSSPCALVNPNSPSISSSFSRWIQR